MKDEIKEILERPNVYSFNDECYLYFGDYNKLKDYITNLQTIEREYSAILSENAELQGKTMKLKDELEKQRKEYQETYKDVRIELKEKNETITNLQEENERLKKENQDFVVEQNALAYYLVKQGLSFEDVVKIINDFKNE